MSVGACGVRACPVCGAAPSGGQVVRVEAQLVWSALREQFEVDLPEPVRDRHAPGGSWALVECASCGLQFFADAPQGDAEFYELLTASPRYYEAERWEFGQVRRRLIPGRRVVDIGCGTGAFLRSLPGSVTRTGLDHNEPALAVLTAADPAVEGLAEDAAEHAERRPHTYDAVTAFQVLEHVERPRDLLRATRRLVRGNGVVYVSVPHRDRSGGGSFEVLDHPPHHLTRWRIEQLTAAAAGEGLELLGHWYEPPDESLRLASLTDSAETGLRPLPAGLRRQAVRGVRRLLDAGPVRRQLIARGYYARRGLTGHTMLAAFRPR